MKLKKGRISADQARRNWRDLLDYIQSGESAIIERAHKPIGVLIPFALWEAAKDHLENLDDDQHFAKKVEAYAKAAQEGTAERHPTWDRMVKEQMGIDLPPVQNP